jgi:hypothetical protein
MTISSLEYNSDYIHNIKSREKINELVAQVNLTSNYDTEGLFEDYSLQSGSPVDVPKTVLFGANKDSVNGHVSYVDGSFIINTTGFYSIKSRIRVGRSGAAGASDVFLYAEASVDGGSNWALIGNSVDILLNTSDDNSVFFDFSTLFLVAGLRLRTRFSRSSTGNDSGDLIPSIPSAALAALGVSSSPSAQVTLYKSV